MHIDIIHTFTQTLLRTFFPLLSNNSIGLTVTNKILFEFVVCPQLTSGPYLHERLVIINILLTGFKLNFRTQPIILPQLPNQAAPNDCPATTAPRPQCMAHQTSWYPAAI